MSVVRALTVIVSGPGVPGTCGTEIRVAVGEGDARAREREPREAVDRHVQGRGPGLCRRVARGRRERDAECDEHKENSESGRRRHFGVQRSCPMARLADHAGAGPRHGGRLQVWFVVSQRETRERSACSSASSCRCRARTPSCSAARTTVSRCGRPSRSTRRRSAPVVAFDVPATNPGRQRPSRSGCRSRSSSGARLRLPLARTVSVTFEAGAVRAPTSTVTGAAVMTGTAVGSASAKVMPGGAERQTRARPPRSRSRSGLRSPSAARTPSSRRAARLPPRRVLLSECLSHVTSLHSDTFRVQRKW